MYSRLETDTHKIRKANRVKKLKTWYKNMCWVGCQPRVKLRKRNEQEYEQQKLPCSKLSPVVATGNFQHRKTKKRICGFRSGIVSEKRLLSCSQ
jgi:hypothetical protein